MARDRELIEKRDQHIKQNYITCKSGIKGKLSDDEILTLLSEKFYLTKKRIQEIINQ